MKKYKPQSIGIHDNGQYYRCEDVNAIIGPLRIVSLGLLVQINKRPEILLLEREEIFKKLRVIIDGCIKELTEE